MSSAENAIRSPDYAAAKAASPGLEPAVELPVVTSLAKRWLDFTASALVLLVLSPVLLLVAVAIRLDSPGPVLFRQQRAGLRGRPFQVLKFRTMREGTSEAKHRDYVRGLVNGEAEVAHESGVFKLVADERVTRVGRLLRRTSMDELPQLWNVLRGEMSLVGPRPPLDYEVQLYEDWQKLRMACRPGITGLWQVSGRSRLSYRQMCELDIEYIRGWSFGLDVKIIMRTLPVVLMNSGDAH